MRVRGPITSPAEWSVRNGGMRPSVLWVVGVGWLVVLAVSAHAVGLGGRRYVTPSRRVAVSEPARAFEAFRDSGARGRVLVLFDHHTDIVPRIYLYAFTDSLEGSGTLPPITGGNIASGLIYAGVVREVYFVPPDEEWSGVVELVKSRFDAEKAGGGYRIRFEGAPVWVLREKDLPRFRERVVVYDADSQTDAEAARRIDALSGPASPDLVVRLSAGGAR